MALPHQIVAIDEIDLATVGVSGTWHEGSEAPVADAQALERTDAPAILAGTLRPAYEINAILTCPDYETMRTMLGLLQIGDRRRLTSFVGNPDALVTAVLDVVVVSAVVGPGHIETRLQATSETWRRLPARTTSPATVTLTRQAGAFPVVNAGQSTAWPVLKIGWSGQRTTETERAGFKYRRQITITNTSDDDIVNRSITVDVGDTKALVDAGKARSDRLDFVTMVEGRGINRETAGFNRQRTFLAFNVTIPAGQTRVYDLIYGNPASGSGTSHDYGSFIYWGELSRNATRSAADWRSVAGTATSGTSSTLTDTSLSLPTNRFRGGHVLIVAGTGAGQARRIASNTATTFTVTRNWTTTPDSTSVYVVWMSGFHFDGGGASSATSTGLTDSSQSWQTNEWKGATVILYAGTGSGQSRNVSSNTATTLTVTPAWDTVPDTTTRYRLELNGFYAWYIDRATTHSDLFRGLWRVWPRNVRPSRIFFGSEIAEGWSITTFLRNNDDYAQLSSRMETIPHAVLFMHRRRNQDGLLEEEGLGDGVVISHPLGYQRMYFDWKILNPDRGDGTPVGVAVVAGQAEGGGDWFRAVEDSTLRSSLTAVAPQWVDWEAQLGAPAKLVYMGGLPTEDVDIPGSARASAQLSVRSYQRIELYADLSKLTITVGPEEAIYDLGAVIRNLNTRPHDRVRIGHAAGNGYYVHLAAGEELWLRTDPDTEQPRVAIYKADGTLVRRAEWAAKWERATTDIDGNAVNLVAREFLPIAPGRNLVTNPTAAVDIAGWTEEGTAGTITLTWSRDAAVFYDAAGSFKAAVTANTTSGETNVSRLLSSPFDVSPGQVLEVAAGVRTSNPNLVPRLSIRWYDSSDTFINADTSSAWTPLAGTWYPHARGAATAPASAAKARIGLELYSLASGATGNVYWDAVVCGATLLWIEEEAMGILTAKVEWEERYSA